MPKNPKDNYLESMEQNSKRLREIEREYGTSGYFMDKEWRKLVEANRVLLMNVEHVERMERTGAKF